MNRRYGLSLIMLVTFLGAAWSFYAAAPAGDDKKAGAPKQKATSEKPSGSRAGHEEAMRKKLASAQSALEGLALEDFGLIAKGARELKAASATAEFNAINDGVYNAYAERFRRMTEKMAKAARDKNADGATLAYVDMTISCVECHKYVRIIPPN